MAGLPSYRAGQRPAARPGLVSYKLSSNETPFPPPAEVLATLGQVSLHHYPDPASRELTGALGKYLGVPDDRVAVGCGSVALCQNAVQIAADAGDEVLYAWRSFEAYPIVTRISGAMPVEVPLAPGARHDVQRLADSVTDRTRVLFVCSPNNPTGPAVTLAEMEWLLDAVPEDLLVVLDEAYYEFVTQPDAVRGEELFAGNPNLLVLRTFSKAFGLAGLRVGYGIGHPEVITALRKVAIPFGVSAAAQAAAVAALAGVGLSAMRTSVAAIVAERTRVRGGLRAAGWAVPDTQTNFVWVPTLDAAGLAADLDRAGLTVRPFPGEGVRISIGPPEANDRVLVEMAEHPGPGRP